MKTAWSGQIYRWTRLFPFIDDKSNWTPGKVQGFEDFFLYPSPDLYFSTAVFLISWHVLFSSWCDGSQEYWWTNGCTFHTAVFILPSLKMISIPLPTPNDWTSVELGYVGVENVLITCINKRCRFSCLTHKVLEHKVGLSCFCIFHFWQIAHI